MCGGGLSLGGYQLQAGGPQHPAQDRRQSCTSFSVTICLSKGFYKRYILLASDWFIHFLGAN